MLLYLEATATVDVRTACNNDVKLVGTRTAYTFWTTIKSTSRFDRINKFDCDYWYWQILFIVCSLRNHLTLQRWRLSWIRSIEARPRAAGLHAIKPKIKKYIYIATLRLMVRSFFQPKKIPTYIYFWFQFHFTHILNREFLDWKHTLYFFWKTQFCSSLVLLNRPSLYQWTNHLGFSVKWLASKSLQITECLSC